MHDDALFKLCSEVHGTSKHKLKTRNNHNLMINSIKSLTYSKTANLRTLSLDFKSTPKLNFFDLLLTQSQLKQVTVQAPKQVIGSFARSKHEFRFVCFQHVQIQKNAGVIIICHRVKYGGN